MKSVVPTIAVVAVLVFGGSYPAQAATLHKPAPAGDSSAIEHCWSPDEIQELCAPTMQEMVDQAYLEAGVQFIVASGELPEEFVVSETARASAAAARGGVTIQSTYILGTFYDGASYAGDSFTVTANLTSAPCTAPGAQSYGKDSWLFFPRGREDWISSFQGYGNCGFKIWADPDYLGSSYGPAKYAPNLGPMSDQASSFKTYKA